MINTSFCVYGCVHADLSVGPEGARVLPGLLWSEKRLQTQESGDCLGAKKRRMPQTGEPAKEGMMIESKVKYDVVAALYCDS